MTIAALWAATSAAAQQPFDLDPSFETQLTQEYVTSVLVVEDGKLVVSGSMVFEGNSIFEPNYGARLTANGTRDPSFVDYPPMGGKLTRWGDKIYSVAGQLVYRMSIDGITDQSFDTMSDYPLFSSLQAGDYHIFPDGRVLFTGTHLLNDTVRGFVGPYRLVWFSNTGYLDTTRVHRQGNGAITTITEDAQGRFLLSGFLNSYEGQQVGRIFRALPDGAFDTSFIAPLEPFGFAFKIQQLDDGRILGVGRFKITGGTDTLGVVRMMPDGSLDGSFTSVRISAEDAPVSLVPNVQDAHILPDGRMIIGGRFDHINGIPRGGIAMLNADGSLSEEFFTGPGCGNYTGTAVNYRYVAGIVPAPNGEYYIHGAYRGYNDGTTNYWQQGFVSRLHGFNVGIEEPERNGFTLYPNPASTQLTVQVEQLPAAGEWLLRDGMGRVVVRERMVTYQQTLQLQGLASGVYLLERWSRGQSVATERVVVE